MTNHTGEFMPAQKHGSIEEIQPDVFAVYGSMKMSSLMRIGRNMVICRNGDSLTLLNPIRLSAEGEAELEKLGKVTDVIRLGCFHGVDDAYCVQRFNARFWCQPESSRFDGPAVDVQITEDTQLPVANSRVFVFRDTRWPECAVVIQGNGGLLVTCDCIQHYDNWDRTSLIAKLAFRYFGFTKSTLIGPIWLKYITPDGGSLQADFRRLLTFEFDRLIGAHGSFVRSGAHAAVERAFGKAFN